LPGVRNKFDPFSRLTGPDGLRQQPGAMRLPVEHVETLIIGGGQAGLAMSHMLSKRNRPHLVLERHRIAERWRSERWDGLHFQGPNWTVELPDFPKPSTDPDAYASAQEIADFIAAYAEAIAAPVRCGVEVTSLRRRPGVPGFTAETAGQSFQATNVVVATGPFQRPVVPDLLPAGSGFFQVHAAQYKKPGQLPGGAVLVVGAGNSGTQIAEELLRSGRRVFLAVGRHRRVPRHYRGRNLHWWLDVLGIYGTPPERRGPDRSPLVMTGAYGGHTIDFRRLAAQGMVLLGHAASIDAGVLSVAPDLHANLAHGDAAYARFLDQADAYIREQALDLPEEPEGRLATPDPPSLAGPPIRQLDLHENGVTSVIWGTGYAPDFRWIDAPVFDARGLPAHRQGITEVPGLYFLGLSFLTRFGSSFVTGVGDDAARLADHIAKRT
jgi:putative flavoprotein involved in K+ transport